MGFAGGSGAAHGAILMCPRRTVHRTMVQGRLRPKGRGRWERQSPWPIIFMIPEKSSAPLPALQKSV